MRRSLGIDDLRNRLEGMELTFENGKKYILRFSEQTNNPWLYSPGGSIPLYRGTIFGTPLLGEVEYV